MNVYEWDKEPSKGIERPILLRLSKREIEYLIWILADEREKMKYMEDEKAFLDEDLLIKVET